MKWPAWEGVYFREFWDFWIFKILFSENAEQNFFLKDGFENGIFHKMDFGENAERSRFQKMPSHGKDVIKGWALSRGNHLGI